MRGPYGPRCLKHVNDQYPPGCRGCEKARLAAEAEDAADAEAKAQATAARIADAERHMAFCASRSRCEAGWKLADDGTPVEPALKCACHAALLDLKASAKVPP